MVRFAVIFMIWAVLSLTSTMLRVAPTFMWIIISQAFLWSIPLHSSTAFAQEKPAEAWWLTAIFVPEQTEYFSLRADEIDPSWTALSPLSFEAMPKDAASDSGWMKRDGFRFSWDSKLNQIHIGTGVYKARDGSTGRFLLVLEKRASGHWQTKFLHKESGEPGFSVLRSTKSGIFWATCMLCSDFRRIVAAKGSYRLQ